MIVLNNLNVRKFECPYCKAVSAFSCVYRVASIYNNHFYPVSLWSCHNCDRVIFIRDNSTQYKHRTEQLQIHDIFPSNEPEVNENVPEGISSDIIEAAKCFNIGAYKASVVICRRAIQKTCLNLGADKDKKLVEQIEELKIAGKLHPDLAEIATEIRILGNEGAHPDNDGLDEIEKDDAGEVLNFAYELIDDLYIRPKKVEAMRNRREQRSTQPGSNSESE